MIRRTPLVLLALAAQPAFAQYNRQAPIVITPPAPSFSLQPASPTPTPVPTTAPSPTPTVAAPPVVRTAPAPAATPVTPRPTPVATPGPRATVPPGAPVPAPSAAPLPQAPATPTASPPPAPSAADQRAPEASAAAPTPSGSWWPWLAGLVVVLVAFGFVAWRRINSRAPIEAEPEPFVTPPAAAPPPTPAARSPQPPALPPSPITPAPPAAPAPSSGLASAVHPRAIVLDAARVVLDFELTVVNDGSTMADGVRALVALTTAGPQLQGHVDLFGANAALTPATDAFSLRPGERRRIASRLDLPRDAMHLAVAGGRPMTVPVLMVQLKWRGGLSVRSTIETHMIGTGDGSAKLGPIWVEPVPRRYDQLAGRAFTPSAA